jgi:hypothetical protein
MDELKRKSMWRTHWIATAIVCVPAGVVAIGCLLLGLLVGQDSGMGAALGSGVLMLLSIYALGGVSIYVSLTTGCVALLKPAPPILLTVHGVALILAAVTVLSFFYDTGAGG